MDVRKNFKLDCYVNNRKLFEEYRGFSENCNIIDFNHASLARPFKEVFEKINKELENEAREKLCSLVGIKDKSKIIFGRNTTEALSFIFWLAEVEKGNVIVTDAENESVVRIFKEHQDHGNTKGKDGWSTFPDKIISEQFNGSDYTKEIKIDLRIANFIYDFNEEDILNKIDENTCLVLVSHVIRNNGKIIDIENLTKKIKKINSKTFIAIDGAQALGNLPVVDFNKLENLGVDFYSATPHKTLGSYPLGILFISERAKNNIAKLKNKFSEDQIIMKGMLPEEYGIEPNINCSLNPLRFLSLTTAIEKLRKDNFNKEKDFSNKTNYLKSLKEKFNNPALERNFVIENIIPQSPAIFSFRVPNLNNQMIVRKLQEQGIFCSYISETNNIRISFEITNTGEDIEKFFSKLDLILSDAK